MTLPSPSSPYPHSSPPLPPPFPPPPTPTLSLSPHAHPRSFLFFLLPPPNGSIISVDLLNRSLGLRSQVGAIRGRGRGAAGMRGAGATRAAYMQQPLMQARRRTPSEVGKSLERCSLNTVECVGKIQIGTSCKSAIFQCKKMKFDLVVYFSLKRVVYFSLKRRLNLYSVVKIVLLA